MARRLGASLTITVLCLSPPIHAAGGWATALPITLVMVDNRFDPDLLTFHAGQPYRLRLENRGKDLHEFTAPEFLRAAEIRDPSLLANGGTDVVVPSGGSVVVFLIARRKGRYELRCADHDWDGMTGTITVD